MVNVWLAIVILSTDNIVIDLVLFNLYILSFKERVIFDTIFIPRPTKCWRRLRCPSGVRIFVSGAELYDPNKDFSNF